MSAGESFMASEKAVSPYVAAVKASLPATAGIATIGLLVQQLLKLLTESDAEKIGELTKLLTQFGTTPILAIAAFGIITYMAHQAIQGRETTIVTLREQITSLGHQISELKGEKK